MQRFSSISPSNISETVSRSRLTCAKQTEVAWGTRYHRVFLYWLFCWEIGNLLRVGQRRSFLYVSWGLKKGAQAELTRCRSRRILLPFLSPWFPRVCLRRGRKWPCGRGACNQMHLLQTIRRETQIQIARRYLVPQATSWNYLHLLNNGERMSNRNEASYVPFCEGLWIERIRAAKDSVSHNPPIIRTQQKGFRYVMAW